MAFGSPSQKQQQSVPLSTSMTVNKKHNGSGRPSMNKKRSVDDAKKRGVLMKGRARKSVNGKRTHEEGQSVIGRPKQNERLNDDNSGNANRP